MDFTASTEPVRASITASAGIFGWADGENVYPAAGAGTAGTGVFATPTGAGCDGAAAGAATGFEVIR